MKKKLLTYTILTLIYLTCVGQDPQFTQFYSNPLYLAPSFAGATEASRVTSLYRNQWAGVALPFKTYSFSFDHYFSTFNSGVGLYLMRDEAGTGKYGRTNINISYSYNFRVFNIYRLRPGLSFGYTQTGIDFHLLTFGDQFSENANTQTYSVTDGTNEADDIGKSGDIDFSTSILLYSKKLWMGASYDHMLKPQISLFNGNAQISPKLSIYGGYELVRYGKLLKPMDDRLIFAFLYKNQADHHQLDLGLYWYNMPIVLGIWYRGIPVVNSTRGDAIALLTGYKIEKFSIGYSYDFTISRLITSTKGAHEVSLVYHFNTSNLRRKKLTVVPCPHF